MHRLPMRASPPAQDCRLTLSVGSMLISALEPADRHELLAHLPHYARCRDEVALLSALPALLHPIREV